ncbi:MAG: hypothetical protein KIT15_16905 [Xanthobacteraceae bacterium]|nr:hypothetical protein [Xanthobacteraceae bacterium]
MTMTEKVEPHTPLPWRREHEYIVSENGIAHASFDYTLDANYSILACNSYPALLAERDRLREALGNLWDAAKEVHKLGASVGGQWVALSLALEQSSPLLKDTNQ